jgi:hypothetical protein
VAAVIPRIKLSARDAGKVLLDYRPSGYEAVDDDDYCDDEQDVNQAAAHGKHERAKQPQNQ